jgi:hypothetical protein
VSVGICEICQKEVELTFHHFIPVTLHTNKKFKKLYEKEFLKTHGMNLCKTCHKTIHVFFTEKELGNTYNSFSRLMTNEKFRKYVFWAKKRK